MKVTIETIACEPYRYRLECGSQIALVEDATDETLGAAVRQALGQRSPLECLARLISDGLRREAAKARATP